MKPQETFESKGCIQRLCTLTEKYCFHDWQLLFNRPFLVIVFLTEIKKKLSLIFTNFIQIDYCTKRTRNLVEFFDISKPSPKHTLKVLHRWCEITDYSRSTASKLSNKCYCIPSLLLSPCFCSCTRINNYISYASLFLKLNFLCPVSAWPIFESALE